ncbi:unnamed protein product [Allacma fusca]|uniref:Uncharacterized protein n=1 Tax=Allacma fusca TaxID=39272 RepID=A0A8J2KI91_9HEXA|nr:unnamed protein product [Allacma fusca]
MISPCYGCDLQTLTAVASWYCFIWDILMIALNCYGIYTQVRKQKLLLKQQAAEFVPQSGNTIDLAELESVRERMEKPRSRVWAITGLGLSILDLVVSVLFIQGVNECEQKKILIWCIGHTSISYSAIILIILAVKCNIRHDSRETPVGFNMWNVLYMIVDLYLLWIGVSFLGGLKNGFEEKNDYD